MEGTVLSREVKVGEGCNVVMQEGYNRCKIQARETYDTVGRAEVGNRQSKQRGRSNKIAREGSQPR